MGLLRPIIKRISGCGLGLGELPKILGLPYNIPANAEASERKFGVQLGFVKNYHKIIRRRKMGRGPGLRFPFAKAHHKITPIGKSENGLGLGKLPKILWFHFNIYTMAEVRDFKFGAQLGPTIKPHPEEKWEWPWVREAPYI